MSKFTRLIKMIKIATSTLLVCYPFIIFISLHYDQQQLTMLFLIIVLVMRTLIQPNIFSKIRWFTKFVPCLGILLIIASWLLNRYQLLLYYPVIINLSLLTVFCYSLKYPPCIIERFARIQHAELSEKAIRYTRKVTYYWCLFFVFNGCIAFITCLSGDLAVWTFYNGGISYLLIGLLMGGEWLIRKKYQH